MAELSEVHVERRGRKSNFPPIPPYLICTSLLIRKTQSSPYSLHYMQQLEQGCFYHVLPIALKTLLLLKHPSSNADYQSSVVLIKEGETAEVPEKNLSGILVTFSEFIWAQRWQGYILYLFRGSLENCLERMKTGSKQSETNVVSTLKKRKSKKESAALA